MSDILTMAKFGALILGAVLGLSCLIMTALSSKEGPSAMKEKVEYGFFGVTGLAIAALMAYALS